MLAISLALALALHEPPIVQELPTYQATANLQAASHNVSGTTLIPFGQAFGTYDYAEGKLLALLEDASGTPLWVLDAVTYEDGVIDGELLPLEYASNPVAPSVQLTVSGQMHLDVNGNGSFNAVIFQYAGGAIPVFPVGGIEGLVKQPGVGHSLPALAGASGLVAAASAQLDASGASAGLATYGPQVVRRGVIVCPKGPIDALQNVGGMAQAGFALNGSGQTGVTQGFGPQVAGGGVIVCPKGPIAALQNVGGMAQAGGDRLAIGDVILCPKGPDAEVQSAGSLAQAGFDLNGSGGLRPIVDPVRLGGSTSGSHLSASASALGEGAQSGHVLHGPGLARVALRWWLDD